MADDDIDDSSELGRALTWLRKEREELAQQVVSGRLDTQQYKWTCGKIEQIDETIKHCMEIRHGVPKPKEDKKKSGGYNVEE